MAGSLGRVEEMEVRSVEAGRRGVNKGATNAVGGLKVDAVREGRDGAAREPARSKMLV